MAIAGIDELLHAGNVKVEVDVVIAAKRVQLEAIQIAAESDGALAGDSDGRSSRGHGVDARTTQYAQDIEPSAAAIGRHRVGTAVVERWRAVGTMAATAAVAEIHDKVVVHIGAVDDQCIGALALVDDLFYAANIDLRRKFQDFDAGRRVGHCLATLSFQRENVPLLSHASRCAGGSTDDSQVDVPDRAAWVQCPQHDVVVASQGVHCEHRSVEEQDARPGVEADCEVLYAIGSRVRGTVAGDDGNVVITVGTQENACNAAGDGNLLDVVPTDSLDAKAIGDESTRVVLRSWFECVAGRRQEVDQVTGSGADRVAAVDEYWDRAGRDVECVVSTVAVERQADVVFRIDVKEPDELDVIVE